MCRVEDTVPSSSSTSDSGLALIALHDGSTCVSLTRVIEAPSYYCESLFVVEIPRREENSFM